MEIDQDISEVTALPGILSPERITAVDKLVEEELPLLSIQLAAWTPQANALAGYVNNLSSETKSAANNANTANSLAQQAKTDTIAAKNEAIQIKEDTQAIADNLVIPIEATYNRETLDDEFNDIEMQEFLDFKF